MPAYQLQIKQVVDYPRCRIYRQFVHRLMADRSIRTSGGSGLFYFTVLCSYANFRTSYRRIDGITVMPLAISGGIVLLSRDSMLLQSAIILVVSSERSFVLKKFIGSLRRCSAMRRRDVYDSVNKAIKV